MRAFRTLMLAVVLGVAGCSVAATSPSPSPSPTASPAPTPTEPASPSASVTPSGGWRWTDPDLQVVDGYYVAGTYPCQDPSLCAAAVAVGTAEARRDAPGAEVLESAFAAAPSAWDDAQGKHHRLVFGGLESPSFVLLTLSDGTRRAVPLFCMPNVYADPQPSPTVLAHCELSTLGYWRVGADQTDIG